MEQGNAFILVSRGPGRLLEVVVSSGAPKKEPLSRQREWKDSWARRNRTREGREMEREWFFNHGGSGHCRRVNVRVETGERGS